MSLDFSSAANTVVIRPSTMHTASRSAISFFIVSSLNFCPASNARSSISALYYKSQAFAIGRCLQSTRPFSSPCTKYAPHPHPRSNTMPFFGKISAQREGRCPAAPFRTFCGKRAVWATAPRQVRLTRVSIKEWKPYRKRKRPAHFLCRKNHSEQIEHRQTGHRDRNNRKRFLCADNAKFMNKIDKKIKFNA